MAIVASAHFVVKLSSLSLNHLLHYVKISVQLLKEQVTLPNEDLFQPCKVGGRCGYLFALLQDMIVKFVLLNVCQVKNLTYLLHIVTFV